MPDDYISGSLPPDLPGPPSSFLPTPDFELDQSIGQALDEQEEMIAPLIGGVQGFIQDALEDQDNVAGKAAKKINGAINKGLAKNANQIDQVLTQVLNWIDNQQLVHDWTLGQLGVKAGVIAPGKGIAEINWHEEPAASLGPKYGGVLVLSCKELGPCLDPLIEVLREIRDRMGLAPVSEPGEPPAEAAEDRPKVFSPDDSTVVYGKGEVA